MPMKHRNISQQLKQAVRSNITLGHSKANERQMGISNRIYSIQNSENMINTANQFGKWLNQSHPEIKWAKQLTAEHAKEFILSQKAWNQNTAYAKASQINQLGRLINATYKCNINLKVDIAPPSEGKNIRDIAITPSDLSLIRDSLAPGSNGRTAVEISSRCGLRIKEISHLRGNRINLDKQVIEVREGAKNGKYRDVPIRDKDIAYFRVLKEQAGIGYVTQGVKDDSLNRAIRRAMERCGVADQYKLTTNHAIRKTYARERFNQELQNGKTKTAAWSHVQVELGHGSQFREKLYNVYIGK